MPNSYASLITSALLCLVICAETYAQEVASPAKSIVGEWSLNATETRKASASASKPGNPATTVGPERLEQLLAKKFVWRFLTAGVLEASEEGRDYKAAYKVVQTSSGEEFLVMSMPHSDSTMLWRASLKGDTLTVTPLIVGDELSWQPLGLTLVLERK